MKGSKTREKIVRGAFEVFSRKGFAASRMDEISSFCGVNKATVYYYFSSKGELYREVLHSSILLFLEEMKVAFSGEGTVKERLEEVVKANLEFFRRNPLILKLFLMELSSGGENLRKVLREMAMEDDFFKKGGFPSYLMKLTGISSFEKALHFWLNILGMCMVHTILTPVIEEVYGIKVDTDFMDKRRKIILEFVEAVV